MTILMDCKLCKIEINTYRPPYCWSCWEILEEGEEE
jgi:uncharacterized Fe-S cluster-containing MiaB family protein